MFSVICGVLCGTSLDSTESPSAAATVESPAARLSKTSNEPAVDAQLERRVLRYVQQLREGDQDVVKFFQMLHTENDATERFLHWWHGERGHEDWRRFIYYGWDLFFIGVGMFSEAAGDFKVELQSIEGRKAASRGAHGYFCMNYLPQNEKIKEQFSWPYRQYLLVRRNPSSDPLPGWRIVAWARRKEVAEDWLRADSPGLHRDWSPVYETSKPPSDGRWHYRDLDSGKWFYRTQHDVTEDWIRDNGVDMKVGSPGSNPQHVGRPWAVLCDTAFKKSAVGLARLTAAIVREETQNLMPQTGVIGPGTYLFRTREGASGVLMFDGSEQKKGRLRWKTLTGKAAARAARVTRLRDGDTPLQKIARGYLLNRLAFSSFVCEFRFAVGTADRVEEAIEKGSTADRLTAQCEWVVDGQKVRYWRQCDEATKEARAAALANPTQTQVGGKGGQNAFIAVCPDTDSLGWLTDGNRALRYDPSFVANLMGPRRIGELIDSLSPDFTPFALGGFGATNNSNIGRWILDGKWGTYQFLGVREVDGRPLHVVERVRKSSRAKYFFDSSRGFLPVRREDQVGESKNLTVVTAARKCSDGRWFPARVVSMRSISGDGKIGKVREIVVTKLDADAKPSVASLHLDLRRGVEVNHADDLRSAFKLPRDSRYRADQLDRLHDRCFAVLKKRNSEDAKTADGKGEGEDAPLSTSQTWGHLKGRFVLDGSAPSLRPLVLSKDRSVFGDTVADESLVIDPKTKGIANIIVFVRTRGVRVHPDYNRDRHAPGKVPRTLTFSKGRLRPRTLSLRVGQTLILKNNDSVAHNAHLRMFANPSRNVVLPAHGKMKFTFDHPERLPVMIGDNIHPWERATLWLSRHPYAAVTGAEGSFELRNLPAGELEFQCWHERTGWLVAKPTWKKGRFRITINANTVHDIGMIKTPAKLLSKEQDE